MTPENFVYWLQGYFELLDASEGELVEEPHLLQTSTQKKIEGLTPKQVEVLRRHLDLTMMRVTSHTDVRFLTQGSC